MFTALLINLRVKGQIRVRIETRHWCVRRITRTIRHKRMINKQELIEAGKKETNGTGNAFYKFILYMAVLINSL